MKTRVIAAAVVVLIALAALAVACGGDGDGKETGIRTRQGLGVAALAAGADIGAEAGAQDGAGAPAPGAPSADTGVSKGGGGYAAPDIFPYSPLQQSQDGITVQGYGSAAITADAAILEFYFGGKSTGVEPAQRDSSEPGSSGGGTSAEPAPQLAVQAQQITEADLKPVVDAIIAAGVPAADVEVIVTPYYGDPSYGGSATVRATLSNVDAVDAVVKAATTASIPANISFSGTNVSYTVSDCAALEQAAMEAAVKDARDRATNFAGVLGVGLGDVAGSVQLQLFALRRLALRLAVHRAGPAGRDRLRGGPDPRRAADGHGDHHVQHPVAAAPLPAP